MEWVIKKIARKEFIIAALIVVSVVIYVLFFKPNPIVRISNNQTKAGQSSTVLRLESPAEVNGVGKKFTVKVVVDTKGNQINAVQSYLAFDPRVLEIVTTNTEESFCKFYPENNYSQEKGMVRLACGAPYPGFRGVDTIQTIEFLTKAIKTTEINITDKSMVLANDGKGTNLLNNYEVAEIRIKAAL